jgi:oligo-1,6-glucosidase
MMQQGHKHIWWKECVVYQVYPASFQDSNGDGIGDIPGLISRLDYIKDLGVDVIWLSPHYQSPQIDMGYDISDFEAIHEPYGTMEDCLRLIDETHVRGMKIIFDLVINHTSDLHPWFQQSRQSKDNPKRDWYFWRPARYDENGERCPPNNWRSNFGGSAWSWDERTEEYYLHVYAPEQPDLNWENPDCRNAIYKTSMLFWLEKGIDGFRIDTVNKYSKNTAFPDAEVIEPDEEFQVAVQHFTNGPRMHEFLSEMNDIFDEYDVMTVGELPNTPETGDVLAYVSAGARQLNMVFNFDVVQLGQKKGDRLVIVPFSKSEFKYHLSRWQNFVNDSDAWTTVFLENHDQGRSISRFGSDLPLHRQVCGKMFSILLATMTGTLFLYQGQEIGMINIPRSWSASEYKDIRSVNHYQNVTRKSNGDPVALAEALDGMQIVARDNARTPMQWDKTANGGFCSNNATPWMRAINNGITVDSEIEDPKSVLTFWKDMIKLRKQYKHLFVYGRFDELETGHEELYSFSKTTLKEKAYIVINLAREEREWKVSQFNATKELNLLATNVENPKDGRLTAFEARVYLSS